MKDQANYARQQAGFTLIELMIVTTLTVMLLLSASTLYMTFLVGSAKVSSVQLVKQEGRYALSQMEFLLRNAIELVPNSSQIECAAEMNEISFLSLDGGTTTLMVENDNGVDKIASNSGVYLTSAAVELIAGPTFNCTQTDDQSHPYITFSFSLRKGTPGVDQARDIVEQTFTSSTTIRSL